MRGQAGESDAAGSAAAGRSIFVQRRLGPATLRGGPRRTTGGCIEKRNRITHSAKRAGARCGGISRLSARDLLRVGAHRGEEVAMVTQLESNRLIDGVHALWNRF